MKSQTLYPRLFAILAIGFILCTIIGTVTHEMGHGAVARYYGFETHLSYQSLGYATPELDEFRARYERDKEYIETPGNSPQKQAFIDYRNALAEKYSTQSFYITLGGPLQTMLAGSIGLLILWLRRKKIYAKGTLNVGEWLAVLLAYFWSRQVFNFFTSLPDFFAGKVHFRGDEPRLSEYLELPLWTVGLVTFIMGSAALLWVTFRLIPRTYRFTFIISGLAGSAAGWFIWMYWVGPSVLPS